MNAFSSYSAKTKRDRQTGEGGGGRCNISRPGPATPREIIRGNFEQRGFWELIYLLSLLLYRIKF